MGTSRKNLAVWSVIVIGIMVFFGACVWQPVEDIEFADSKAAIITRRSVCCAVVRFLFVHESCGSRVIRIGKSEWADPAGGYWTDTADGAILFATWHPLAPSADVYLLMPASGSVYHVRVPYSYNVHFFGGNFGIKSEVEVLRQSKTQFVLRQKVLSGPDMVIDFQGQD